MAVPSGYIIAEDGRKERAIRRKPAWISTPEKGEEMTTTVINCLIAVLIELTAFIFIQCGHISWLPL
jgi:hypothetical protein